MTELSTRRPTGKAPWPIVLLAGAEKVGKSYAAAQASASDLIGRTLWVSIGEDDPDELGSLPGADFEIVLHDGTYRGILRAVDAAAAQKPVDGKPNLIVLDSMTRLWDLLCDEAQVLANDRAARKAAKSNRPGPVDDVQITMDLWNTAKQRWQHIIDTLREHDGPSLLTARLELVTVMDGNGNPTKDRSWKVKAEKSLPYDVGVIVEMPARGETYLTGVRSLRFKSEPGERVKFDDFTVVDLWTQMGLTEPGATSPRQHTGNVPDAAITQQPGGNPHSDLLREIAALAVQLDGGTAAVAATWAESHGGQDIRYATDVGGLELLRDDLAERARQAQEKAGAAA
jgi:hypothetical protein